MSRRGKPDLSYVVFEVTRECNLGCRYCYNVWLGNAAPPARPSSYRRAKKTLARAFRVARIDHVSMTGGEPFLAERFAELVLFCRLRRKSVAVITNGNAASERDYAQLLELGVGLFELPLHSASPSAHDAMTGTAGSWRASRGSIRQIQSLGGEVTVAVVLTAVNRPELRDTLLLLVDAGVRSVMLNRFNVGGRGIRHWQELTCSPDELREAYRIADELAGATGLKITSNVCTPYCLLDPDAYPQVRFARCSVNLQERPVTLDFEGNLRICNHSPVIIGNIHHDPIERILDGNPYVARWRTATPPPCSGCELFPRCFGGCRAAPEQLGLSLAELDPTILPAGPPPRPRSR